MLNDLHQVQFDHLENGQESDYDIAFFNQYALHSPQRQIAGNACSGRPAADNEYLCIQF